MSNDYKPVKVDITVIKPGEITILLGYAFLLVGNTFFVCPNCKEKVEPIQKFFSIIPDDYTNIHFDRTCTGCSKVYRNV